MNTLNVEPDVRNLCNWAMGAPELDTAGKNEASRLYFLAAALPDAPAGDLLDVAKKDKILVWSADGKTVSFGEAS